MALTVSRNSRGIISKPAKGSNLSPTLTTIPHFPGVGIMASDDHTTKWTRVPDLVGQVFGRLTVIRRFETNWGGQARWVCECTCGNTTLALTKTLRRGTTRSCGCLKLELLSQRSRTHGDCTVANGCQTFEYASWRNMKQRCYNPSNPYYRHYGGRGISVCDRWLNSFESFLEDMGRSPSPDYSIHRKDNDKGYCPENCEWADTKVQRRCTSRNRMETYHGETRCVSEWSEITGISYGTLISRLKRGWTIEKAINTPIREW